MNKQGKINVLPIFLAIVVFAVFVSLAVFVFGSIQGTQTSNTTIWNVTRDLTAGVNTFTPLFSPLILLAVLIFLMVVIGLFIKAANMRGNDR